MYLQKKKKKVIDKDLLEFYEHFIEKPTTSPFVPNNKQSFFSIYAVTCVHFAINK